MYTKCIMLTVSESEHKILQKIFLEFQFKKRLRNAFMRSVEFRQFSPIENFDTPGRGEGHYGTPWGGGG